MKQEEEPRGLESPRHGVAMLSDWRIRLRNLFGRKWVEDELDEELRFHLEQQTLKKIQSGMNREEAARQARIELGGVEQAKEEARDARGVNFVETTIRDVRYGLRQLRRSPGFTIVAILTLALGIGANTAIFSVVNGVLLKPLPYPEPQKLVTVWSRFTGIGAPGDRNFISAPEFRDIQQLNHSLSGVAATHPASFNITSGGTPERVEGAVVSPALFPILGVSPVLGRAFTPDEAQHGRDRVLLLGYGLWVRRFGSDPHVIGRSLDVNGQSMLIVGVLPKGFNYPFDAEIWQPMAFSPEDLAPNSRGDHGLRVLGRIKPGLTVAQARADMERAADEVIARNPQYPYKRVHFTFLLVPLLEQTVGSVKAALWVLCGAVGFVLLIACVNMAGLLLGRASAREREMAIRSALGARRGRIVRQLLTESLLLSGMGGLVGLLLAPFALSQIVRLGSVALPRVANVQIDGWVLLFTVAISLLTGLVFGLFPAWRSSRGMPYEELKEGGRAGSEGVSSGRARQILVAGEVAFSVVLLTGAGLLMLSFLQVLGVDPGFHADRVLTMRTSLPSERYSQPGQVSAFYREILRRIRNLPGVQAAGAVAALPLSDQGGSGTTTIDTQAVPADRRSVEAAWLPVTPGYFQAVGITLLRGRDFTENDSETSAPVAIVDQSLAQAFFPNENPIGKRLHRGGPRSPRPWRTIVGVVAHVHYRALEAPSHVQVYWPEAQLPNHSMSLAIRTSVNPLSLSPTVQSEILAVDPDQPVYEIRSMNQWRSDWLSRRFLALLLVGLFAALALVLTAVGIYGVMSNAVSRRAHEIGIRMALGALPRDVMAKILSQGARVTGIGLGVGILAALGLTRLISALLYGVTAANPLAYLAGAALLALVALAACYFPARRAMQVDPAVALRHE